MQILIKKIDEAEPTTVLNDVYMILEFGEDIEFYMKTKEGKQSLATIFRNKLEYFRKVGD